MYYRAEVDLSALPDGGTVIHWSGSWRVGVPGVGYMTRPIMRHLYRQFTDGLATAAANA